MPQNEAAECLAVRYQHESCHAWRRITEETTKKYREIFISG
jgi:hypothetical protein